ncbi:MAG: MerR family transcriptional regulator [Clostridiales bacterium]|nr:MerR family transcriptional regulator [Clostridiales bacterium]
MSKLIKIRDVSSKYDISARTLRYYEDMGLISSTRSDEYAYRLYDEASMKRLEQILILRKLNISVKDIQRIFSASGSEAVLDVLGKKVSDIDGDIALLHELREIVMEFIRQIEQADFSKTSDVKMLYDKAKEIEGLVHVGYEGNPSVNMARLQEVTEKLKKAPEVRIVQIKPFRAVTSGLLTFDAVFGKFMPWMWNNGNLHKQSAMGDLSFFSVYCPHDFKFCPECGHNCQMKGQFIWAVEDGVTETDTAPYEIVNFEGGLYAAAMSVDEDEEMHRVTEDGILKWLETSGFEQDKDSGRRSVTSMLNPSDEIKKALGYNQLEMFMPIKIRVNTAAPGDAGTPVTGSWSGLTIPSQNTAALLDSFQGKDNVLQVTPGENWSVLEYDFGEYSGREVNISISMDVWLNTWEKVAWQAQCEGYPLICGCFNSLLMSKRWNTLSVSKTFKLDTGILYISKDLLGKNDLYITNFSISVTPVNNG